jgi:putative phosphoesterase
MKVGILSDTHGNIPATKNAVAVFRKEQVSVVFHCGDIGSFDVLSELVALERPIHAVFGNVDIYSSDWKFFPTNIGVQLHGRLGEVVLGGKQFALLHSDDLQQLNRVVSCGSYDFILTGHTHAVHDYMDGNARCINPGTAGRGTPNTCAVLDLESGKLKIVNI